MKPITMNPIGVVHSPYRRPENMPVQGIFKPEVTAWVELKDEYSDGLKDLDAFSHAILIYYFHKSRQEFVQASPFLEDEATGRTSTESGSAWSEISIIRHPLRGRCRLSLH